MIQDQLTICRKCSSPGCYETFHQNLVTWKCIACGYTSNSYMMKNTDVSKAFEETLPSLYKDIKFTDSDGFNWYPLFFDMPPIGLVFANGSNANDWTWTAVPYAKVQYEEREKFKKKDGTYAEYKTDMSNAQHFGQFEFSKAIEALQAF